MAKRNNGCSIKWANINAKLGDLKPWAHNPRMSTKSQAQRLLDSWREFGQVQTIAVGPSMEVYDGHQRLSALLTLHGNDYEVDARQSSRALTDNERKRLVVTLHAGAVGAFNWDVLSSWDDTLLRSAGFNDDYLRQLNVDAAAVAEMLRAADGGASSESAEEDHVPEQWAIVIQCESEYEQVAALETLSEQGYKCKALIS